MSRAKLRRYVRHGLLPQLFVFEAVARLGSATRAAEELHLAQPTVSMQLKKLAETLDVRLLEQRGRQLHLTAAGHALRDICDELMQCLARADDRLSQWRAQRTETLLLAAEPEARQIASRLLAEFCGRHPGVQASLRIAERPELLERFGAAKDDVYFFELLSEEPSDERRWTVAHARGGALADSAARFFREAMGPGPTDEENDGASELAGSNQRNTRG